MTVIKNRFYFLIVIIIITIMAGSFGYFLLFSGKEKFIDCVYMTVISLTSVGYGEILPITGNVSAEIFTMILITFGMGIILYAISTLTAILIEGEIRGLLRKKKMDKLIQKLRDHYIVCGGGETGYPLVEELLKNREKVVLIEQNEERLEICATLDGILYIRGDATEDQTLLEAGIERAVGVLICLPSDKDNLFVTMTARMLNSRSRIISRMINPKLEPKLLKAGADRVVSPNFIGALRMASEAIRPTVVDFLDNMLRSKKGTLRIHQIIIYRDSGLVDKTIGESGIKQNYDLLVLAAKHGPKEIEFNIPPNYVLKEGMQLIVMGEVDNIERARLALKSQSC